MEINDALVTAITRELLKRLGSGEFSFSEADVKKVLSGKDCCCPECAPKASSPGGRRRVISETEIQKLCPASSGEGQCVEIGTRDIITPLAEDYIAKMRITVNRIG